MPVKGVLVTLGDDPVRTEAAISQLEARPDIELGERREKWLPLVIEAPTEAASREVFRWIESVEGVYFVDTVFSSVDGPDAESEQFEYETSKREQ